METQIPKKTGRPRIYEKSIQQPVYLSIEQKEFIKKYNLNLSKIVRNTIDHMIIEEKAKSSGQV